MVCGCSCFHLDQLATINCGHLGLPTFGWLGGTRSTASPTADDPGQRGGGPLNQPAAAGRRKKSWGMYGKTTDLGGNMENLKSIKKCHVAGKLHRSWRGYRAGGGKQGLWSFFRTFCDTKTTIDDQQTHMCMIWKKLSTWSLNMCKHQSNYLPPTQQSKSDARKSPIWQTAGRSLLKLLPMDPGFRN